PFRPASARRRSRPAHVGAGPCVPGGRATEPLGTVKQTQKAKGPASCDAEPFSVSQTRHTFGGTHFCPHTRVRNSFPPILLRLADFRGARALAKIGALRQRRLAVSSTGCASPPLPLGTKFA